MDYCSDCCNYRKFLQDLKFLVASSRGSCGGAGRVKGDQRAVEVQEPKRYSEIQDQNFFLHKQQEKVE